MSRDYYFLNNFSPYGTMGISHRAFITIVETATNHVSGASVFKSRKNAIFKMTNPVKVFFRKDGRIDINLDVSIKKGESVGEVCTNIQIGEVCTNIQNSVADALLMMCETVPFRVHIKVSSLSK